MTEVSLETLYKVEDKIRVATCSQIKFGDCIRLHKKSWKKSVNLGTKSLRYTSLSQVET